MFFNNIDRRNLISIVLGLIIATFFQKYFLSSVFDSGSLDKNFINGLFVTFLDIITTMAMILLVYYIYPIFLKKKT